MKTILKGQVVLFDKVLPHGLVTIEGKRISDVRVQGGHAEEQEKYVVDHGRDFIAPGFIDLHVHGALGRSVMEADEEGLNIIGSYLVRSGVTGFLPTTLSASINSICDVVAAVKKSLSFPLVSKPLGLHIEGPFLNPERAGVQDKRYIKPMTELDFELIATAAEGLPVVLTMAPEVAQNSQFIPLLRDKGVVVGIGHSEATYEQTMKAIDSGLTHAAHFFNALGGFHHRVPGAVGAVLESEDVTAEIIPDGIHIHPASLKLVIKTKGVRNVCLVTDSIETAGLGEGIFKLRGQEIEVRENRALRCGDGILAGGISNMIRGVRNVMEWTHLSLDQAVRMVSLNPARILGLDSDLGSIVRGKHANLTVFNGDYQIKQVYVYGKPLL